jgi:hypothetical protein
MKTRGLLSAGLLVVTVFLLYDRCRTLEQLRSLRLAVDASRSSSPEPARSVTPAAPGFSRPAPALEAAPPPVAPVAPARGGPPGPEPAAVSMTDRIAHIETVFNQQSVDGSWATGATTRLEQGLSRIAKGSRDLGQVECRSSLCRARYDGNDPSKCEEFARDTAHQTAPYFWEGPYTVKIDPARGGTGCSVSMLFGREGTDLPSID